MNISNECYDDVDNWDEYDYSFDEEEDESEEDSYGDDINEGLDTK